MNYAQMCEQALNSTCSSAKRDSVIASYASQHGVSGIPLAVATMLVNPPSTIADDCATNDWLLRLFNLIWAGSLFYKHLPPGAARQAADKLSFAAGFFLGFCSNENFSSVTTVLLPSLRQFFAEHCELVQSSYEGCHP